MTMRLKCKCRIGLHDYHLTTYREFDKFYVLVKCGRCSKLKDVSNGLDEIDEIGRMRNG
jgi:hypothetical protein